MPKEQSPGKPTTRRYTPEEKASAVRMVRALREELGTDHGTVQRVARQLGYGIESVRFRPPPEPTLYPSIPFKRCSRARRTECRSSSARMPTRADCSLGFSNSFRRTKRRSNGY